jgi:nucleoside-diphosphate-sugar epimerase
MEKRVLITGVGGFIGFHLAMSLTKDPECQVIGVDNFQRGDFDEYIKVLEAKDNFELITGDLNSSEFVYLLPSKVDYVYHLATINGTQNFYSVPYDVAVSCVIPTWNLIEHFKHDKSVKFILAGTPESYASTIDAGYASIPTPESVLLSISSSLEPRWSYAAGKIFAEVLVSNANKQFGLNFLIVRFHNIYGPRMGPFHLIPDFLRRVQSKDFELYGGSDTRSFLFVSDAVSDLIALAENSNAINDIYNIGSNEEISVLDIAKRILAKLNSSSEIKIFPAPSGSVSRRSPDTSKIDKLLGNRPRILLDDGLDVCIKEYFPSKST